ncbi:MAG: type IV toxin-antitoxin system AbiEi family antitoxin [bacterium]
MESKINNLLLKWPKGTVATAPWLRELGISRQLARRYASSGWIQSIGCGAFIRTGDAVSWLGGFYALQSQLKLSVYVGGDTALSLNGLGHYLPMGEESMVHLFSERRERLPAWFKKHAWGVKIQYHRPSLFKSTDQVGYMEVERGEFSLRISSPERAILEILHLATTNDAITHAVELMSGLSTLRPQVLQPLLEGCSSVKVKRIFLWAAESAGHEWFSRLTPERLDLGKGNRSLYRGGQFNSKYRITVPKEEEAAHV